MRRTALGSAATAAVAALAFAGSSAAATAIDADYLTTRAFVEYTDVNTANGQPAAGDNTCNGNLRAFSGGTFWDGPVVVADDADEYFTSSLAPFGKRTWYGAGGNASGVNAAHARYVHCLPKRKLRGSETGIKDVPVADLAHGGGHARCPKGTRLFGGGAFWHDGGGQPEFSLANDAWLSSSYPDEDRRLWYADGENRTGDDAVLRVVVRCLPPTRLSKVKLRRANYSLDDGEVGGGPLMCPPGTAAFTGGAYRHRPGDPPLPADGDNFRISSTFHYGAIGFPSQEYYADGHNFSLDPDPWVLTVVAQCLT